MDSSFGGMVGTITHERRSPTGPERLNTIYTCGTLSRHDTFDTFLATTISRRRATMTTAADCPAPPDPRPPIGAVMHYRRDGHIHAGRVIAHGQGFTGSDAWTVEDNDGSGHSMKLWLGHPGIVAE